MRAVRLAAAVLAAGLLLLGWATPARAAADSVLVRVGGDLSARVYQYIDVPITVDLSGAPGRKLGSYRATLSFNPTVLQYVQVKTAGFAQPLDNTAHAADSGKVLLTAVQPAGATGAVTIFIARFYVRTDTLQSPVAIAFDEMSATATSVTPFESLLPLLKVVNGVFCRSLGRWGDVNGDGLSNSLDALVALSVVVGIPIDTTNLKPYLADVDADGRVTSRDALIILSYGVGLPVPGYRILLTAAGACGTGAAITLAVAPDSLELQAGQGVAVLASARDATGRAVPVDSVVWTSSDPSIAAYDASGRQIVGRAPGVATLTAQLGPGVAGRLKVSVLARRVNWYVDVERARLAPTQVGSQNLPMEFIGEALALANNGDTLRVASGIYEELIASYRGAAVTIIGDSVNRPILDPRGAPYWYTYQWAIDIEPYQGLLSLANLVVRAGKVYLDAHNVAVRNVRIEGLGGTYGSAALEIFSRNLTPGTAPQAGGPMRSSMPTALGNVLVDGVVVVADSTTNGIVVDLADTAVIQNSTVTRSYAGTYPSCGAGPSTPSGIRIYQASVSLVRNNTVANPQCQGIGAFDYNYYYYYYGTILNDVGRVTISRNRVTGAPGTGIGSGARLVSLDHNAVRGTGLVPGQRSYGYSTGIHVTSFYNGSAWTAPDSITSVGDTILNSGGRGFAIDTVSAAALLDSLVVNGTGRDSSYSGYGVDLEYGGRYTLSHSRVSGTMLASAVYLYRATDSVRILGSTVDSAGYTGIWLNGGVNVRIDSTLVTNSRTNGILFLNGSGGRVARSRFDTNHWWGVRLYSNGTSSATVRQSVIQHSDSGGAQNIYGGTGSVLYADSNYWGDLNGPRCRAGVSGCGGLSATGDYISSPTPSVVFSPWLSGAPLTPAPPFAAGSIALPGAAQSVATSSAIGESTGGGGPPRPANLLAEQAASAAVSPEPPLPRHEHVPAWHAPSRARGAQQVHQP